MSEVLKVLVPQATVAPRGAVWAADALVWLARALTRRAAPGPRGSPRPV